MIGAVDLAIVGAGPAGAAAAITAARAGLDVALIDRSTFPRDKCCGDGLTAAALRELDDLGLDPAQVPSWQPVQDVVLHAPSTRRVEIPLPAGPGLWSVVARRRELDAALVELALKAGAALHEGRAVTAVRHDGDVGVELELGTERIRAAMVIAADGMWSPVRKLVGAAHPTGYRGEWHAFRQYLRGGTDDARARQHIWFPADLLPAYVWSFPLPDGALNVGFGLLRGGPLAVGDGGARWRQVLARPEVRRVLGDDVEPEGPLRAWPIPARIDRATLSGLGGRVLFAGDAATAPDPMTGEGIGQALLTGRLAALGVLQARAAADRAGDSWQSPRTALEAAVRYRRAVRSSLVADHRLASGLSRVLSHRGGAELALRAVDAGPWTRRNFGRWMFEDYPRAVLGTPRRWGRGMLNGTGAFASMGPWSLTPIQKSLKLVL